MEYGVTEMMVNASPLDNPSISLRDPEAWAAIFGDNYRGESGVMVTPKRVLGFPPCFRAIDLISDKIAGTPIDVLNRGADRQKDLTHNAYLRLGKGQLAAPLMSSLDFEKLIQVHAMLYGNGYALMIRNHRNEVAEMIPLDPTATSYNAHEGAYLTIIGDTPADFAPREIFHLKGLTIDGLNGEPLIALMANALGLPLAMQIHGSTFFKNGSAGGGVLQIPGRLSKTQQVNAMKAWKDMNAGSENAHRVMLTQDGVKFQPTTYNPEQSQFNESREHELRATVANIYGIPAHLIGDTTRTSFNSIEQENQSLLSNCLRPWFDRWESEITVKMLSPQARAQKYVEFNTEDLQKLEYQKRVDGETKFISHGVATVNQVRARFNMPSAGPEGDTYWRPSNWMPADQLEPPSPPSAPSDRDQTDTTENQNDNGEALKSLIKADVERYLKFESDRIKRTAAKNPAGFWKRIDAFYADWVESAKIPGIPPDIVREAYKAHATAQQASLLAHASAATDATLAASVEAWAGIESTGRAHAITAGILKDLENG